MWELHSMADGIQFQLTGLDSLLGKLDAISYETKYKGGRSALRKAAQLVRDKARDNAKRVDDPRSAEDISKNIVERWNGRRFKTTGDLAFRVGVLGGARQYANTKANVRRGRAGQEYITGGDKSNPGGDTYYWRFLEFGTAKMRAQPFMRPALENSLGEASAAFITEYEKAIDRAIKRAAKKASR
jgi:HK97 gp10 family phage protein